MKETDRHKDRQKDIHTYIYIDRKDAKTDNKKKTRPIDEQLCDGQMSDRQNVLKIKHKETSNKETKKLTFRHKNTLPPLKQIEKESETYKSFPSAGPALRTSEIAIEGSPLVK